LAAIPPDASIAVLKSLSQEEINFLLAAVEEEGGTLRPHFDFTKDLHFPQIEGKMVSELKHVIENLIAKGLIDQKLSDRLIACPECGSHLILTYYTCPFCGSRNVLKENLHEHFICGAISRESTVKQGDKLVCPVCKREFKALGKDYSIVGAWFECEDCKKTFEAPVIMHKCLKCGLEFDVRGAKYDHVVAYSPTPLGLEVANRLKLMKAISEVGASSGFEVEWFGTMKGVSGIIHEFSLLIKKQDLTIAVDIASNGNRGLIGLTATLAKVYDTPTVKPVVAIIPKAPAETAALAARYNIVVVEGDTAEVIKERFADVLKRWTGSS